MKKTKLGQDLIGALHEAFEHAAGKIDLRTSQITLPDVPPKMTKRRVKQIRESLHVSQPVLARFLGVSASVVKAWEQGYSQPNGAAARLLQIAGHRPEEFPFLILEAAVGK